MFESASLILILSLSDYFSVQAAPDLNESEEYEELKLVIKVLPDT